MGLPIIAKILGSILWILSSIATAESASKDNSKGIYSTETRKKFIEEILKQNKTLPREFLEEIFLKPELRTPITMRITPECRDILRIKRELGDEFFLQHWMNRSVTYYEENQDIFLETKRKYGVPPEDILALLRAETYFGTCNGSFPVLRQLYTLYHDPKQTRKGFFLRELIAFLELSFDYKWDPYAIYGSEAGALGSFQFMPSSIKKFAVDANGNNIIDIFDPRDVIPSIANFLVINHWKIRRHSAFWNYNRDLTYVQRVLSYADIIREKIAHYHQNLKKTD